MAEISIDTTKLENLSKVMKKAPPEIAQKALPAAVNRTLTTVSTQMQKEITTRYKIKKSDITGGKKYKSESSNNLITVKKASSKNPSGQLTVRGSTLTLSRFLQGQKVPISHKGKTMKAIKRLKSPKVQVKRGGVKSVNRAFIQRAKGTTGIFVRDENNKLRMLRTLSVAQMAGNKEVLKVAEQTAIDTLEKRMVHEIEYRLNKMAGDVSGNT